ncbi:phosphatase PAP2 family protein [Kordiimonas sp.]|uniref:phosphatase PAP2 family protein n=1 Tax=Kordiimonas sp. TaxID=1970157 RepID=UPI003A94C3BB
MNALKQLNLKALFAGALVFAAWAYATFSDFLEGFDRWGLMLFRKETDGNFLPIGPEGTPDIVMAVTHMGDTITLIVVSLALVGWILSKHSKTLATRCAAAITGVFLISPIFKFLFDRDRPDIVEQLAHASSKSFPSGHALRSAGIYLILYVVLSGFLSVRGKQLLFTITSTVIVLTSISRVYLGVHWPTDIVASWIIALTWLYFCKKLLTLRTP